MPISYICSKICSLIHAMYILYLIEKMPISKRQKYRSRLIQAKKYFQILVIVVTFHLVLVISKILKILILQPRTYVFKFFFTLGLEQFQIAEHHFYICGKFLVESLISKWNLPTNQFKGLTCVVSKRALFVIRKVSPFQSCLLS